MAKLNGKVVLVVGGSAGIGEGCVRLFQENQAKIIFCSYNKSEGEKLEQELNELHPNYKTKFVYCDVRNDNEVENVVKVIEQEYGGQLDVLLNIVGYHPVLKPALEFSVDEMRDLLNVNVVSHFNFARLCIPMLRKTKGSIVNMSSLVSFFGQKHAITYVTTKTAILGLTMGLALDEAEHGVRVNSLSPGFVKTPLYDHHVKEIIQKRIDEGIKKPGEESYESITQNYLKGVPMKRQACPREIANMCLFLATDGSYATGADFKIDGGLALWND